jgi:hypothetical protein
LRPGDYADFAPVARPVAAWVRQATTGARLRTAGKIGKWANRQIGKLGRNPRLVRCLVVDEATMDIFVQETAIAV